MSVVSKLMRISLGQLTLDPIAPVDLAHGDVDRAVNAAYVVIEIGEFRHTFDGVAAPFLLLGIYWATLTALTKDRRDRFFCLDDPGGGNVMPVGRGRVRIEFNGGVEQTLSGSQVLSACSTALSEIAEFLAASGYPVSAQMLLTGLNSALPQGRL